jgi:enoyl-CoA hydratase/carnithine racemase
VRIGLGPDFGLSRLLPSTIGTSLLIALLLTARTVRAEEGLGIGLVSRVTDDALATSVALAEQAVGIADPAFLERTAAWFAGKGDEKALPRRP